MKKSEFEKARIAKYRVPVGMSPSIAEVQVRRDVEAAEAAGVTWDPEEGPAGRTDREWLGLALDEKWLNQKWPGEPVNLPERLVLNAGPSPGKISVQMEPAGVRPLSEKEEREAVRRYNKWPALKRQLARREERFSDLVLTRQRAEKAETEVHRLGGVIDEYCKADTKLRAEVADLRLANVAWASMHAEDRARIDRQMKQANLLVLERDALKLAVQEGEAEVGRLREHQALLQGFLSDDKETFKRFLRELLRLEAESDGEEVSDGE